MQRRKRLIALFILAVVTVPMVTLGNAYFQAPVTNQIHADTWVTTSETGVAAWLDSITRMRFRQQEATKRPVYKMGAIAPLGDDANLLNGYAVMHFDGENDFMRSFRFSKPA